VLASRRTVSNSVQLSERFDDVCTFEHCKGDISWDYFSLGDFVFLSVTRPRRTRRPSVQARVRAPSRHWPGTGLVLGQSICPMAGVSRSHAAPPMTSSGTKASFSSTSDVRVKAINSICAAARRTLPERLKATGASPPAMPREPCPEKSKALALRS